ncbi:hypothetical protein [Altericroceibacterium endophyticum]|uniref:Uncharacterized protein n=1 Tax=Altericroceibacterium endophyticum TaxID=1808508 RepID=A0A6I4T5E2_9SPHN|nr:hypothetical protein [Altericroceibacterium endophyticum]MXO66434.1 hypothetical protein [Altericroceibacterium endophyticum]
MPLDITNFPLVWMSYEKTPDHDHDEDFKALEASFARGEPFVILTDNAPTEDHEHSQEEKKRTALWLKNHKTELRTLVQAMIVIEPSATKRMAFKPFGVAFGKLWGFPLKLTSSRQEAMDIAGQLLAQRTGTVTA